MSSWIYIPTNSENGDFAEIEKKLNQQQNQITAISSLTSEIPSINANIDITNYNNSTGAQNQVNIGCNKPLQTGNINLFQDNNAPILNIANSSFNPKTINIGAPGDTVNLFGALTNVETTNLEVKDNVIQLNKNGPVGSSANSGIQIQDGANASASYIFQNGTADQWLLKATNQAQPFVIDQSLGTNDSVFFLNINATSMTSSFSNASILSLLTPSLDVGTQIQDVNTSTTLIRKNYSGGEWDFRNSSNTSIANLNFTTGAFTSNLLNLNSNALSGNVLTFTSANNRRKINLAWVGNDNDFQNFAIGTTVNAMRLQVPSTGSSFIFSAGLSSSTDRQLLAVNGSGELTVGSSVAGSISLANTSTSQSLINFTNAQNRRKINLNNGANDFQATAIGMDTVNNMRLQVGDTANAFVFSAGLTSSTERQILTIQGTGQVLLNTDATLTFGNNSVNPVAGVCRFNNALQKKKIVLSETALNQFQFTGFGTDSSSNLNFQVESLSRDFVFRAGNNSVSDFEHMRLVGASGQLSLSAGMSDADSAQAVLRFANVNKKKKIAFFDTNNNNFQYAGIGLLPGDMRFQMSDASNRFSWGAGLTSTTETELVRLNCSNGGQLQLLSTVGDANTAGVLTFANTAKKKKLVINELANNNFQYNGIGLASATNVRFQGADTSTSFTFAFATGATTENQSFTITNSGISTTGQCVANSFNQTVQTVASSTTLSLIGGMFNIINANDQTLPLNPTTGVIYRIFNSSGSTINVLTTAGNSMRQIGTNTTFVILSLTSWNWLNFVFLGGNIYQQI